MSHQHVPLDEGVRTIGVHYCLEPDPTNTVDRPQVEGILAQQVSGVPFFSLSK
jgi:hypothetical protein